MTQNDDGKPGAQDNDILSAIRRIVDEEQTGAAPAKPPAAPASGRGAALVLTPTMRVNATDDDADEAPPLRLTKRVDDAAGQDSSGRSLRSALGRDDAQTGATPMRLQPAARVDDAVQAAPAPDAPAMGMSGFAGQSASPGPDAPAAPEAAPPAPQVAPAAPEAAPPAPQAAPAAAPAPQAPAVAGMTRDELDALITEKLRQDLSGELGVRISANIRTLVQREVSTAVAAALAKRQP